MCGIIGVLISDKGNQKKRKTAKKLKGIFENQKSRGVDGAGFLTTSNFQRCRYTNANSMFKNKNLITSLIKKGETILFHHRLPTSNKNVEENNHPILNEKQTMALIHNGGVFNFQEVEKILSNKKHRFETGSEKESITDSEVIIHLIEESMKGTNKTDSDIFKAVKKVNAECTGNITIAFVIKGRPAVYIWKRHNPIIIYKDKMENKYFSSEFPKSQGYKIIKSLENYELVKLTKTKTKSLGLIPSKEEKEYDYTQYYTKNPRTTTHNYENNQEITVQEHGITTIYDVDKDQYDELNPFKQFIEYGRLKDVEEQIWNSLYDISGERLNDDMVIDIAYDFCQWINEAFATANDYYDDKVKENRELKIIYERTNKNYYDNLSELNTRERQITSMRTFINWINDRMKLGLENIKSGGVNEEQKKGIEIMKVTINNVTEAMKYYEKIDINFSGNTTPPIIKKEKAWVYKETDRIITDEEEGEYPSYIREFSEDELYELAEMQESNKSQHKKDLEDKIQMDLGIDRLFNHED